MRCLIVGAGAVGQVFYRAIEQQKGNECTFLVRPGRKRALERLKLVDARTGTVRVRERPAVVELGQVRPPFDTVLFCVRGDQLGSALDDVGAIPPGTRLATITPGPEGLALLRSRHPGATAVRIGPAFMAYPEADTVVTWMPPLAKSPICYEGGGPEAEAFANELAAALMAGGIPAKARDRMPPGADVATAAMMPILAAYAVSGYDADAMVRDKRLLNLAGEAIAEIIAVDGGSGLAGSIARRATRPVMRAAIWAVAPRLPGTIRTMWRVHGPKIDSQTREGIAELLRRARDEGRSVPALESIQERLAATAPPK